MKILISEFFSLIKSRIGIATSVPLGENIKLAVATSKFCSIFLKLHNLIPMVNCHYQELEQLDWMKSGQLLHPTIHCTIYFKNCINIKHIYIYILRVFHK